MEPLKDGITYGDLQQYFAKSENYSLSIEKIICRTKKAGRKKEKNMDRKTVRLIVQKMSFTGPKTLLKKNLKGMGENYLTETVNPKVIATINAQLTD